MNETRKEREYIDKLKAALRALKDIDMNDFFKKAIEEQIEEEESTK